MAGRGRARTIVVLAWGFGVAWTTGGCTFGPKVLELSHGRYNEAVRRVHEEQLLRNLVHMRYNEPPLDLNVSSIAAQYELDGGVEARPFFQVPNPSGSTFRTFTSVLPDVNVSGANRPTLTLIPADNGDAVQKFLTPISAETLHFLVETSWPVATVLRLWVEGLNGVPNAASASGPQRDHVSDFERFRRVAELLQLVRNLRLGDVRAEERPVEVSGPLPASVVTGDCLQLQNMVLDGGIADLDSVIHVDAVREERELRDILRRTLLELTRSLATLLLGAPAQDATFLRRYPDVSVLVGAELVKRLERIGATTGLHPRIGALLREAAWIDRVRAAFQASF